VHAEPLERERVFFRERATPMSVVATWMLVFSAKIFSARCASAEMMPPPT